MRWQWEALVKNKGTKAWVSEVVSAAAVVLVSTESLKSVVSYFKYIYTHTISAKVHILALKVSQYVSLKLN